MYILFTIQIKYQNHLTIYHRHYLLSKQIHSSAETHRYPQINAYNTVNLIFVSSQIPKLIWGFKKKSILFKYYDIAGIVIQHETKIWYTDISTHSAISTTKLN